MLKNFHLLSVSCFFPVLLMYFILLEEQGPLSSFFYFDENTKFLMIMTSIVMFLIWFKSSLFTNLYYMAVILLTMNAMFYLMFMSNNMFNFYIFFEMSVVPLMFLVSYWGYSLERIKAMFYMFLYTFIFSMPFLFFICWASKSNNMNIMNMFKENLELDSSIHMLLLTMILVKMPVWAMHLWLMKAHVEASTEGSMVLASVVLKLSGIAILKMLFLTNFWNMYSFLYFITLTSIVGAIFLSFYIMRQSDLKLMIAVSSVVHMSFMYLIMVNNTAMSVNALLLVMVAHGIISPLMFMYLGLVYDHLNSRNMLLIRGFLKNFLFISIIWFLLCMYNMSVPLTLNFFAEVYMFFLMYPWSMFATFSILTLIFFNGVFNIYMFSVAVKGQNNTEWSQDMNPLIVFFFYSLLMMVAIIMFI